MQLPARFLHTLKGPNPEAALEEPQLALKEPELKWLVKGPEAALEEPQLALKEPELKGQGPALKGLEPALKGPEPALAAAATELVLRCNCNCPTRATCRRHRCNTTAVHDPRLCRSCSRYPCK